MVRREADDSAVWSALILCMYLADLMEILLEIDDETV